MARIYTEEKLESEVLDERNKKAGAEYHIFEIGEYRFGVVYIPGRSFHYQHLGFYAMSQGFEQYTETGYKSNFVQTGEKATREEILEYFLDRLREVKLDLSKPMLRMGGIVKMDTHAVQLSLF